MLVYALAVGPCGDYVAAFHGLKTLLYLCGIGIINL